MKIDILRAEIDVGLDALDRGKFVELDGAALEEYLERLTRLGSTVDPSCLSTV